MSDQQIIFLLAIVAILAIFYIVVRGEYVVLQDQLAMARHTIAELAPKAKAWDESMDKAWSEARTGLTAQAAAAREQDFRVNYQHLSAECSDGN